MNQPTQTDLAKWGGRKGDYPEPAKQTSPMDTIALAVQSGYDPALIEKMMDLQERHERHEAKKAYIGAMVKFKKNPPTIEKDRHVKHTGADYHHASLSNVAKKINAALSQHNLEARWETTEQSETSITVKCVIRHKLGHEESTQLTAPLDSSGSKNAIQSLGSTITYLERYTILALTGLATDDMDDDGNAAGGEYIDEDQLSRLRDMIDSTGAVEEKFLKYMGVEKLEDIPKKDYQKGITALKASAESAKK